MKEKKIKKKEAKSNKPITKFKKVIFISTHIPYLILNSRFWLLKYYVSICVEMNITKIRTDIQRNELSH